MKLTVQEIIRRLNEFWQNHGCVIHQGYDLEMGAGTFNPATFLRCLGPEPYYAAYVEPSRRPTDGRYGENPNRVQMHHQYQVLLKPSPDNLQELYLDSLRAVGFDLSQHDVRFVHDDWEAPTLGAWGLGWEVWMDGMEVTQFTYFQCAGGQPLKPVSGELTLGLERLSMYLLKVDNIFDLPWNEHLTYGDIFRRNEFEFSTYNFEEASTEMWFRHFDDFEREAKRLAEAELPLPAYDFVMKASHAFNILDARGVISVTERTGYIARIRDLATLIAASYVDMRRNQGHPLLQLTTPFPRVEADPSLLPPLEQAFEKGHKEDFLLEIGSEELPASFVSIGIRNLKKEMEELLQREGLSHDGLELFGTPRRLAVVVKGLATGREAQHTERKGPALDKAFQASGEISKAGQGFFKSLGFEPSSRQDIEKGALPQVEIRELKGQPYLFARLETPARSAMDILAEKLPALVLNLDFPKKMRWGDLDISYARPLRWIVALMGQKVVPFIVGNLASGKESSGHRQLCPGSFEIPHPREYLPLLRDHKVMADLAEREASIRRQLADLEAKLGGTAENLERVVPQVLNLVEWPQLTAAEFDAAFLQVPKEVLVSEMVEHQKYFPVAKEGGTLMNHFIITADNTPSDQIRHGNQMVLSARLSDGVFLYQKDLEVPLEQWNRKLQIMTYMKGLGSMMDKVERLRRHAATLAASKELSARVDKRLLDRAALLCKADLASHMVYEFPELQGVMGKIYALAQGESPDVAQAIEEHWMPRGEGAALPETPVGLVLSLADKVDNLLACFGTDNRPTSSSDPYALRRQVLGIVKMMIRERLHLDFRQLLTDCHNHFPKETVGSRVETVTDIWSFVLNRIRTVFQDYGFAKDEIEASLSGDCRDLYDTFLKVQALHRFRRQDERFSALIEVHKRARGQIEGQKTHALAEDLLKEKAEKELYRALCRLEEALRKLMERKEYDDAYALVADIQPYIDRLFYEVKILDDDLAIRHNRIALLQRVFHAFSQLLDLGKIQEATPMPPVATVV